MMLTIVLALVGQDAPEIAPADFARLQALLRPQTGESPWRDVEWRTGVRAARREAAAAGKPILIFTAADGSPLSRT